jgi:hypothetical protein
MVPNYATEPWTAGTTGDALIQSASGATIPLSLYPFLATKDNTGRIVTLVGGNPLVGGPVPITIDAVVIPLQIVIGTNVFDPTAPNSCDGDVSAVTRFRESPLVVSSKLVFNGVDVGSTQYIDGFMRAEFWDLIKGAPDNYSTKLNWSFGPAYQIAAGNLGITSGRGCKLQGIISQKLLSENVNLLIPLLQSVGLISPTKLVVFLLNNVVTSGAVPPNPTQCCTYGLHGAQGSPIQTYARIDYDTTGRIPHDMSIAAHEIGEWMNDPLGHNATPKWGNVGQSHGCKGTMEVGDPLTGTNMPVIKLSGYDYHLQELAFFSWFFNAQHTPSIGAGGEFSGHGTFEGPAKACPPGGSY